LKRTDNSNENTIFLKLTPQQLKNHSIPKQSVTQMIDDTNELFVFLVVLSNFCSVK